MSEYRKYGLMLSLLFITLVLVEYYTPKPVNWEKTFSNKDKIPYGTYVLYDMLPDIFPDQQITPTRLPVTNQLEDSALAKSNYIFVNQVFSLDSLDLNALLHYVERGNNVFISAENYDGLLESTLGFTTVYSGHNDPDSLEIYFTGNQFGKKRFAYQSKNIPFVFKPFTVDEIIEPVNGTEKAPKSEVAFGKQIQVLGENSQGEPVFLKVKQGRGAFYLSSTPLVFCNYHTILPEQNQYAAIAFSHLPVKPVLWDEYQKLGRAEDQSVLRVLMQNEPLSWAYYITLSSLALFLIFESKRRQRIIPVWESPRNTTLEFVQVVGNLYYNYKNHKIIAEKKINYFFEYLRLHYFEQTHTPDVEFADRIAAKSGMETEKTGQLFALIRDVRNATAITEQELARLNKYLEEFYRLAGK